MSTGSRRRLAVVGGGMGGVSAAYLCDGEWATDLFEARSRLGGNASTLVVQDDGQEVVVDIGAESFNAGTHPLYWALLEDLGAIGPDAEDGILIEMPGTLSVFDAATRRPLFVSSHPLRHPVHALSLLRFTRAARRFVADDPSPDVTVGDWLDTLPLSPRFKTDILSPWLASLTVFSVTVLRTQSLLAFLLLFVKIFPANVLRRPKTYCSRIGLGGVLQLMADGCRNLTVHTEAPVSRLERVDGSWFVDTPGGRHGPYEKVVVNAPPPASREFLIGVPDALLDLLGRQAYYRTRMIIHEDPLYMPANRRDWCTHNAAVDGDACEATIWLGAFRTNPRTGRPVRLFKSWATVRAREPESILAEQTFHHSLLSPETLRAAKELADWQGVDGLFFAGHYTTASDLQETALTSGVAAAAVLSPESLRLGALRHRVAKDGRAGLSPDAVGR